MENIYKDCVSNDKIIYRDYDKSWDEQLDNEKKFYEDQGYKVIFTFFANSFQDRARVVLYDKETLIPQVMREYRNKYVKFNGHWCIEANLGICDICGEYKPLICLCNDGWLCKECANE